MAARQHRPKRGRRGQADFRRGIATMRGNMRRLEKVGVMLMLCRSVRVCLKLLILTLTQCVQHSVYLGNGPLSVFSGVDFRAVLEANAVSRRCQARHGFISLEEYVSVM